MSSLRYGSVCSGIEAATAAWHPLGWEPAWFSEIEKFPCAVLSHRYPDVPNLGDMTKITKEMIDERQSIHLLVGGTPCQSFSVAGLRKGLDDPRGNLALEFLRIADAARPRWIVWENVPGVLSSAGGRDFGSFLGGLGQLGYGWSYRVLDAQYVRVDGFGRAVPQRRRRVFVVGYLGDWRRAAAVLFERESLCWDTAPSRKAGQGVARNLTSSTGGCSAKEQQYTFVDGQSRPLNALGGDNGVSRAVSGAGSRFGSGRDSQDTFVGDVAGPLSACGGTKNKHGYGPGQQEIEAGHVVAHSLTQRYDSSEDGCGRGVPLVPAVAFQTRIGRSGRGQPEEISPTLQGADAGATSDMRPCVAQAMAVRRLTPIECERLQAFPDNYTRIPWRKKTEDNCPDGPRYKALGNSMACNVMRWIGTRISMAEANHG